MTTNQNLSSKRFPQSLPEILPEVAQEEAVNLLFLGFLGTVFHTLIFKIFGEVWLLITIPNQPITLATLVWCWGLNIYLALVWRVMYKFTGFGFCLWVQACYLFAILEFYIVWDNAWFYILGLPMTSNTLIGFGFGYHYWERWKLQNS